MRIASRSLNAVLRAGIGLLPALAVVTTSGAAQAFTARFSWQGIPACSTVSPPFVVSGAPKGTKALRFVMHDENAPAFEHGGSTVDYAGGTVPKGAIHYIGPCPPGSERHRYAWTIEALGTDGRVLATSVAKGTYPPR